MCIMPWAMQRKKSKSASQEEVSLSNRIHCFGKQKANWKTDMRSSLRGNNKEIKTNKKGAGHKQTKVDMHILSITIKEGENIGNQGQRKIKTFS